MKKIMFILACCLTISGFVFAQESQVPDSGSASPEIKTLFHAGSGARKIEVGHFFESDIGFTHLGHTGAVLPGFSGGLIFQHHWTIGFTANFIADMNHSHGHHDEGDTTGTDFDSTGHGESHYGPMGGYGGMIFEYTLLPLSRVHVGFPLIIGFGSIHSGSYPHPGSPGYGDGYPWHHQGASDHFFVLEPGVKLEVNLIKCLRLGVGLSYRYSPDTDHKYYSSNFADQLTGRISLAFGKF